MLTPVCSLFHYSLMPSPEKGYDIDRSREKDAKKLSLFLAHFIGIFSFTFGEDKYQTAQNNTIQYNTIQYNTFIQY